MSIGGYRTLHVGFPTVDRGAKTRRPPFTGELVTEGQTDTYHNVLRRWGKTENRLNR